MPSLVSILIPAYNSQAWIAYTLRSALAQTWAQKEIIVVDDGSQDGTLDVARRFESAQVKVVAQPNQGAAAARNKAYSLAQGQFIQWLDADDLLSPDKVALQMASAAKTDSRRTLYSAGWAHFMYRPEQAHFAPTGLWEDLAPVEWMTRKLEHNLHMQTATWLTSRELIEQAGTWNTTLATDDDGEYYARIMRHADAVRFVPGAKVYYRISPSSRVSYIGRNHRKMEAQLASMQMHIDYLRAMADTPRVRAACVTYLQNWQLTFYPERPDLVDRARKLAQSLGGELLPPRLSWKYAWIQKTLGWQAAKLAQVYYNQSKAVAQRRWDYLMFRLSNSSTAGDSGVVPRS